VYILYLAIYCLLGP